MLYYGTRRALYKWCNAKQYLVTGFVISDTLKVTGVEDLADDQRGRGQGSVASLLDKGGTGTWGRCWVNSLPRHYCFLFLELWPGTNFEQCQFGYPLGRHWVWPWKRNPMPGKEGEKLSHLLQILGWGGAGRWGEGGGGMLTVWFHIVEGNISGSPLWQ